MNDFFLKKDYNRYVHPSEIFEWQVLDVNKENAYKAIEKKPPNNNDIRGIGDHC